MSQLTVTLLLITILPLRDCTSYDLQLPLGRYDFSNDLNMQTAINSEINEYKERLNKETLNRSIETTNSKLLEAGPTTKYKNFVYATPSPFDLRENRESNAGQICTTNNCNQRNESQMETTTIMSCAKSVKTTKQKINNKEPIVNDKSCEAVDLLSPKNFIGTNLFSSHRKKCFMPEDVVLLATRLDFEILIPKTKSTELLNSKNSQQIVQQVFYDILGGFLHYYLVPIVKLSFYADHLKLQSVKTIIQIYEVCKSALNTNGNGWRTPKRNMLDNMKNVDISPLIIETRKCSVSVTNCALLDLHSVSKQTLNDHIIVALPKLEPPGRDGFLSNICLPFKKRRIFNLLMPKCSCVFLKFYRVVTHCYQFQNISQQTYNKRLMNWIFTNLGKHFDDEKFYPGLGGVLLLYESLRRNLSDISDYEHSKDCWGSDDMDYIDDSESDFYLFESNFPTGGSIVAPEKRRSANFIDEVINIEDSSNTKNETFESQNSDTICSPCDKEFENDEDDEKIETTTTTSVLKNKAKKPLKHKHFKDDFISFIKIFLALMLLLLFCILCSCLCNSLRSKPMSQVNYSDKSTNDTTKPVQQPDDEKSKVTNAPCCGLFRSRKRARERMKAIYEGSEIGPMSIDRTTRRSADLSLTSISSQRFQPKKNLQLLSESTSSKQTSEYSLSPKKVRGSTYRYGNKLTGFKTNFVTVDEKPKQKNYSIVESASSATIFNKQKMKKQNFELDAIQSLSRQRSAWTRFKKSLPKRVRSVSPARTPLTKSYNYSSLEKEKRRRQKGGENGQDEHNTGSWETTFTSG